MSQIHYLPLTPGFFAILVGIFVIVLILRSVRYAWDVGFDGARCTMSLAAGMCSSLSLLRFQLLHVRRRHV
jgi:hypothetical protein